MRTHTCSLVVHLRVVPNRPRFITPALCKSINQGNAVLAATARNGKGMNQVVLQNMRLRLERRVAKIQKTSKPTGHGLD